jgi:hypothetical protein
MSESSSFSRNDTVLDWNSWLDYENLNGLDSHLSRVYHTLATQTRFALIVAERELDSLRMLAKLNEANLVSVALQLHEQGSAEVSTAFFIQNITDVPNYSDILNDVSNDYHHAPYLVPDNRGGLRVCQISEAENNRFELEKLRPNHLRRMLTLMLRRKIIKVETGVFDANPLITRLIYRRSGLISDVPFHLLRTACSRLGGSHVLRARSRQNL